MRIWPFIVAGVVLCTVVARAAAPPFVADHKAFAEDERTAFTLKGIADSHQFTEEAARRLMPQLLVDGLTPEELDLFFELLTARSSVEVRSPFGPPIQVPPPDGNARAYMALLKTVVDEPKLDTTLDERWLKGPRPMKEFVDISTLGSLLNVAVTGYGIRKFGEAWMSGGAAALREELGKFRVQLAQTDADTERRGKALAYAALRDVDRNVRDVIPDELYSDLKP